MKFTVFGAMISASLPAGWFEEKEYSNNIKTSKVCRPADNDDVEIVFFRRQGQLSPESVTGMKNVLSSPAHRISAASAELIEVSAAMGHVGNNQWTNSDGLDGAGFRLIDLETLKLTNKSVLYARGTFVDSSTKKAINEYCGTFFEDPSRDDRVEEIYLSVPSRLGVHQFEKYRKIFIQVLESVEWA